MEIQEIAASNPIIPVIVIDDPATAVPTAEALLAGGITTAEVTFRTPAAAEAIRLMSEQTEIVVGAGTIINLSQSKEAIDSGAKYIVQPGYGEEVVAYCQEQAVPVLPAATDGTLLMKALNAGLTAVKFFPAEILGGLAAISALSAPFPGLSFIPTGGVKESNLGDYLSHAKVLACGGTWIATRELIAAGNYAEITRRCEQALAIAKACGR